MDCNTKNSTGFVGLNSTVKLVKTNNSEGLSAQKKSGKRPSFRIEKSDRGINDIISRMSEDDIIDYYKAKDSENPEHETMIMFIYHIVQSHDFDHPITKGEIKDILEKQYRFENVDSRKVAKSIRLLRAMDFGVFDNRSSVVWYEKEEDMRQLFG